MGRGASTGRVKDYYKKKGQASKGEGSKRRRLSKESAERRARLRKRNAEIRKAGGKTKWD